MKLTRWTSLDAAGGGSSAYIESNEFEDKYFAKKTGTIVTFTDITLKDLPNITAYSSSLSIFWAMNWALPIQGLESSYIPFKPKIVTQSRFEDLETSSNTMNIPLQKFDLIKLTNLPARYSLPNVCWMVPYCNAVSIFPLV